MRRLRRALRRLNRAFRLTRRFFSLAFLKSRHRDPTRPRSPPISSSSSRSCSNFSKFSLSCPGGSIKPRIAMAKSRSAAAAQRHCGRPVDQLILLACNPCAGSTSGAGMVVESYKFQIQGKNEKKSSKNAKNSGEIWERERSWNIVTRVGDDFVTKKVILKKKSKKNLWRDEEPIDPDFSGSCSSSRYRLSTSSSAADDQAAHHYAWDRDLSFASGDDRFFLDDDRHSVSEFPAADRLEACSKDVFIDPLLPVVAANPALEDSFFSIDHYIRSMQSAGDKHFPSPDFSTSSSITINPSSISPSPASSIIVSSSPSSANCSVCDGVVEEIPMPAAAKAAKGSAKNKVGGVPVAKISMDPYSDYKDSMLEMSAANGLEKLSEFRELLQCYLSLNPPEFHPTIMEVFTELFWHRLV